MNYERGVDTINEKKEFYFKERHFEGMEFILNYYDKLRRELSEANINVDEIVDENGIIVSKPFNELEIREEAQEKVKSNLQSAQKIHNYKEIVEKKPQSIKGTFPIMEVIGLHYLIEELGDKFYIFRTSLEDKVVNKYKKKVLNYAPGSDFILISKDNPQIIISLDLVSAGVIGDPIRMVDKKRYGGSRYFERVPLLTVDKDGKIKGVELSSKKIPHIVVVVRTPSTIIESYRLRSPSDQKKSKEMFFEELEKNLETYNSEEVKAKVETLLSAVREKKGGKIEAKTRKDDIENKFTEKLVDHLKVLTEKKVGNFGLRIEGQNQYLEDKENKIKIYLIPAKFKRQFPNRYNKGELILYISDSDINPDFIEKLREYCKPDNKSKRKEIAQEYFNIKEEKKEEK
ncbi:hypothetical protein HRbin34_00290 [bacterium HR34]|nr:hypothetical protein HRbin34_00290 [bacterium HR34]